MSSPYNRLSAPRPFEHRQVTLGGIHPIHNWNVPDLTALAALSVTSADVGKVAKIASPQGFYVLVDQTGPVWASIMIDPDAARITVSATEPGSPALNDIWIQVPA